MSSAINPAREARILTGLEAKPQAAPPLDRFVATPVRWLVDAVATFLLFADLMVVTVTVTARYFFNAPVEWADDVARGLMVALAFFGAAGALARDETMGIAFFVVKLPPAAQRVAAAVNALIVVVVSACAGLFALQIGALSVGQTTGSGLPLEWTFYPMGVAGVFMTVLAVCALLRRRWQDVAAAAAILGAIVAVWWAGTEMAGDAAPHALVLMLAGFVFPLIAGLSIGFVLAISALVFIWVQGVLPGVIFAQQMARGIDTFVLLAIPFFILVGYLMEANGMSARLISLLERLVGRLRGGLNVVVILAMVIFSGISGSKLADVAAVGTVLVPAARRSKQNPGETVGLLAASAVMAETIPPCINLILLGFVANISIGGLFVAGLLPAALMAIVLIVFVILAAPPSSGKIEEAAMPAEQIPTARLWLGAAPTLGLVVIVFAGFKSGFATATEISAFGALYALVVGGIPMRRGVFGTSIHSFTHSAVRAGMVLFIIAASQAVAYVLTLEEVPATLAAFMIKLTEQSGSWLFMLLSIATLILMGSVLEGAAALIIFGPLLVPVGAQLGLHPLHYGIVLIIAMGIGLFAPPIGMGLYSACLIGRISMEQAARPTLLYMGILLVCLLLIAFIPPLTLWLPRLSGYP